MHCYSESCGPHCCCLDVTLDQQAERGFPRDRKLAQIALATSDCITLASITMDGAGLGGDRRSGLRRAAGGSI